MNNDKPLRIVIMAKAPVARFAKTRLIPALGAETAAALATKMLQHTVSTAINAKLGVVEICATPDASDPIWRDLRLKLNFSNDVVWSSQGEGDLGARMARATKKTIEQGEGILLIGTDCPAIDTAVLRKAAVALQHQNAAIVPTYDGGYALLGLNQFDISVFNHMPWSTDTVAQETLKRTKQLGWLVNVLPMMHDIDEANDLKHLPLAWGYTKNTAT